MMVVLWQREEPTTKVVEEVIRGRSGEYTRKRPERQQSTGKTSFSPRNNLHRRPIADPLFQILMLFAE